MENLKLAELKQEAKRRGVVGYSKMQKIQLVNILSQPEIAKELCVRKKARRAEDSLPEIEQAVYKQLSIDERPDVETQKIIAIAGGVINRKSAVEEYLDMVAAVPVPDSIIEKMTRSKLQNLEKQSGTKVEMFRNLLRKEISGLLMVV